MHSADIVVKPFMLSLKTVGSVSRYKGKEEDLTYISSDLRSSSLSIGWSTGVSISCDGERINVSVSRDSLDVGTIENIPRSKDCLAIPREASLPAKLPYIPSGANKLLETRRDLFQ